MLADTDADGVNDNLDAFPTDDAETVDTDGDGQGNNADTDDDGDTLLDTAETAAGTNPLLADTDADGVNDNLDAFPNYSILSGLETWQQIGDDIDGDSDGDEFGFDVSLSSSGDYLAIGAPYDDQSQTDAGLVQVYTLSGSAWSRIGPNILGDAILANSGYAVSLSSDGGKIAVGALGQIRKYTTTIMGTQTRHSFHNGFTDLSSDGTKIALGGSQADAGRGIVGADYQLNGTSN